MKTTTVRLPDDLLAIVLTLAKDGGRSRNGQIVWMLRRQIAAEKGRKA